MLCLIVRTVDTVSPGCRLGIVRPKLHSPLPAGEELVFTNNGKEPVNDPLNHYPTDPPNPVGSGRPCATQRYANSPPSHCCRGRPIRRDRTRSTSARNCGASRETSRRL